MVKVDLKGIAKVTAKGHTYWYAWRGGPRLRGQPGSPEFHASYNEAIEERRTPDTSRFRSLVVEYRASTAYTSLSLATKKRWTYALDRIAEHFGDLRIAQFDRPEKIRPVIRQWRRRFADTPRTADHNMQVLRRVLSHAVELGRIAGNPAEGIKALYTGDRSEIIWTTANIANLKAHCSTDIAYAVDLAAHTGLRLGDLLTVCWSHVGDDAIVKPTNKSKHQREAIVPLYDDLRAVLAAIPKRSTTILTNSKGRPWSVGGFGSSFIRAKVAAGLGDVNLHFHDLRGTAATRFYAAGLKLRVIAEIMG
jgi:integrase